jgi:hypothetical protein
MDFQIARWAILAELEIFYNASSTNYVQKIRQQRKTILQAYFLLHQADQDETLQYSHV